MSGLSTSNDTKMNRSYVSILIFANVLLVGIEIFASISFERFIELPNHCLFLILCTAQLDLEVFIFYLK